MTSLKEKKIFDGYDHNQIEKYSFKYEDVKEAVLDFQDFLNADLQLCRKETNEDLIEYIEKLQKIYIEIFGDFQD